MARRMHIGVAAGLAALALGAGACDSAGTVAAGAGADATDTAEPGEPDVPWSYDPDAYDPQAVPETMRLLVNRMEFPAEKEPGVVDGFDLDGVISDGVGDADCGWEDWTAPDGTPGVDNQMARLTPLFEPVGLGQAFEYLENSIEDSGFFIMFELRGIDSLDNDDSVELVYEQGGGSAVMDPHGDMVPWQTMCVQNDSPSVVADDAYIEDGVLHARFAEATFIMSMFERVYPFEFKDLRVRAAFHDDGSVDGVVGGALALSNLMALVVKGAQNTGGFLEPMTALLSGIGDMTTEEGPCTAVSSVFEMGAVPVFFFPKDSGCDPCGNGVCEYFESCETCVEDCCSGCGNGMCDVYPVDELGVSLTADGFEPLTLDLLVGDTVTWTNDSDGLMHLTCDHIDGTHALKPGGEKVHVVTESGAPTCRLYELPGVVQPLYVEDNHTEHCESCPQDCGDCE